MSDFASPPADGDWSRWSREAVSAMKARNAAWMKTWAQIGARYDWDLARAELVFRGGERDVVCDLTCVGTISTSEGTFLWAWANEGIPQAATVGLERVRAFGAEHDLGLLKDAEWRGGRGEGLEMVCVAGRILDVEGTFVDDDDDGSMFFVLQNFRTRG